jgi:hypothetical protein
MSKPQRSLRLEKRSARSLTVLSGAPGEIFFDNDNGTLRVYTDNAGDSIILANRQWVTSNTFDGDYNNLTNKPIIPGVTGLATETYVDDAIAAIPVTDLTGLATETYVDDAISNIPGVDLTGLATETYVDDAIAAIPVTDLTGLATVDSPTFTGTVTIPLTTEVVTPPFHPAHLAPGGIVQYLEGSSPVTGTVSNTQSVVYHTIDDSAGAANWIADFDSLLLPTTSWTSKTFAIICNQGTANAWLPTAVQIGGVAQTVQWQGDTPTGTVNGVDIISFTFIRRASDWLVLGSGTSYL